MTATYDGIVLGAGHNGLILQAYLGKAGMKVLCIERKGVAGGGLATLEDPRYPGFLHNTHAFFQRAITAMPWYADLELERHGARYIEPELNVALDHPRRPRARMVDRHRQDDRIVREFSARDARRCKRWHDEFVPIVQGILAPGGPLAAAAGARAARAASRTPPAGGCLEVSALSPLQFVDQEFEHPTIKAGTAVLQRAARGRPAAAGLRAPYRLAAGEPRQGADVTRRLRRTRARTQKRRCVRAVARSGC